MIGRLRHISAEDANTLKIDCVKIYFNLWKMWLAPAGEIERRGIQPLAFLHEGPPFKSMNDWEALQA